jgi:hypothetical protein
MFNVVHWSVKCQCWAVVWWCWTKLKDVTLCICWALAPKGTGTIALDPTFRSFTLLEPVSHYVDWFHWWRCLDWNRLFWCSECGHNRWMCNMSIYWQGQRVCDALLLLDTTCVQRVLFFYLFINKMNFLFLWFINKYERLTPYFFLDLIWIVF